MSYDSANLTTPDIRWLGLRPSDLDKYKINQQCRLAMTDEDLKMGRKLVSSFTPRDRDCVLHRRFLEAPHQVHCRISRA